MSAIIEIQNLHTSFGEQVVHRDINLDINAGEIVAVIGGSGCGKSTMLREIIGLQKPTDGKIKVFGEDVWSLDEREHSMVRKRYGVLFQNGALFSSLNVAENVASPLREQSDVPEAVIPTIVKLRLALSGLASNIDRKMPSELSGGMRKRVALARALALEPELIFLDEPTSGLDPINARAFDHLVKTLSDSLGLTVVMVTHDLDSIESIADRVIVLGDHKVIADGPVSEVKKNSHPWIVEYFNSRAA